MQIPQNEEKVISHPEGQGYSCRTYSIWQTGRFVTDSQCVRNLEEGEQRKHMHHSPRQIEKKLEDITT